MNLPEKIQKMELYQSVYEDFPVRLDANESFIPIEEPDIDIILDIMKSIDYHRYPDPCATKLCEYAAAYFGAAAECCTAGNGSDELISVILSALLPKGGRLLLCEPDFSMYRFYAALYECIPYACERQNGLPDLQALRASSQQADALILSNPCNPTGQGIRREDMLSIIRSTNALCVIDEAYMDFWNQSIMDEIAENKRLIILKTCSKNIGLAGIRLGFAFAHPDLAAVLRAVKSPYNVNTVTQAIGAALLSKPETLRKNTERILSAKQYLVRRLSERLPDWPGVIMTGTVVNFVLLHLPDAEAAYQSLRSQGIAVRRFPGILRITAGTEAETDRLVSELDRILK